jgi:hypothetical protein
VLWIVLPVVTATSAISGPIAAIVDILPVRIVYIAVIIIYCYIIVSAPSAVAAPAASSPGRSHSHPNAE